MSLTTQGRLIELETKFFLQRLVQNIFGSQCNSYIFPYQSVERVLN